MVVRSSRGSESRTPDRGWVGCFSRRASQTDKQHGGGGDDGLSVMRRLAAFLVSTFQCSIRSPDRLMLLPGPWNARLIVFFSLHRLPHPTSYASQYTAFLLLPRSCWHHVKVPIIKQINTTHTVHSDTSVLHKRQEADWLHDPPIDTQREKRLVKQNRYGPQCASLPQRFALP